MLRLFRDLNSCAVCPLKQLRRVGNLDPLLSHWQRGEGPVSVDNTDGVGLSGGVAGYNGLEVPASIDEFDLLAGDWLRGDDPELGTGLGYPHFAEYWSH